MTVPPTAAASSGSVTIGADQLVETLLFPELASLRDRIGVFKRVARNPAGFPGVRPRDCMTITDALRAFLTSNHRRFAAKDEYVVGHFFAMVEDVLDSDIRMYPSEVFRLLLVRAEALIALERETEAIALLEPYAQRPYLIEDDFGLLAKLLELDLRARMAAGRLAEIESVALGRVRLLSSWRPAEIPALFRRNADALALAASADERAGDIVLRRCARALVTARRLRARHKLFAYSISPAMRWLSITIATRTLKMTRRSWMRNRIQIAAPADTPALETAAPATAPGDTKPVLITRAMGGLGDIAMMTAGANALAKRLGQPVYFAVKRGFFPLLENNPNIRLIDVDAYFDVSGFRSWRNLSNCPASRYEVRVAPYIKKGRVETFARGMGVKKRDLDAHGWEPVVHLSQEQRSLAAQFRARHAADGRALVGVQPYSRDAYKNCAAMFEMAQRLAKTHRVFVFHSAPLPLEEHENLILHVGDPLRDVLAMTSALDYYVAVDSAFFHIAAAFDVPTLGVFGPTDGVPLSRHHRRCHLARLEMAMPCAPCWRNEDSPCVMTRSNRSACLAGFTPERLVDEFEVLRAMYPAARRRELTQ